jgi:hypothetical protein
MSDLQKHLASFGNFEYVKESKSKLAYSERIR